MIAVVRVFLALLAVWFVTGFTRDLLKHRHSLEDANWGTTGLIGFVVNFFDVLGIGAFAPQTALLKFTRQTEDRLIPGTMNVANTIPVVVQALIFITIIEVEPLTLVPMLASAAVGAIVGAGIVARLSERRFPLTMGIAVLCTAAFMLARPMAWIPRGWVAIGLLGCRLVSTVLVNRLLG